MLVFLKNGWFCECLKLRFIEAEIMAVSMTKSDEEVLVYAVYRPPSNNVIVSIGTFRSLKKDGSDKNVILAGDSNINTSGKSTPTGNDYITLIARHGLENVIQEYTNC